MCKLFINISDSQPLAVLVPEMRIAGIRTFKDANSFFNDVFLPKHKKNFAVEAADTESVFIKILPSVDLDD